MDGRTFFRPGRTYFARSTRAFIFYVLYLLDMSVITSLVKEFHTGTVSVWTFCQTSSGKLMAYANNGKVRSFPSIEDMDSAIAAFKGYGYDNRAAQLVKQLSLI